MRKSILFSLLSCLFAFLFVFTGCSSETSYTPSSTYSESDLATSSPTKTNFVTIKYRNDPVDLANPDFEYLDTSGSSFIRGAWYDSSNQYMVIKLDDTYYHYCDMPSSAWNQFQSASSFGTHYKSYIKGNYDCRKSHIPDY